MVFALRFDFLFGDRFLRLTHTGRVTGRRRHAALEVIRHEAETSVYFVAAGWGDRAQWVRNIRADPRVEVRVGGRDFPAVADILPDSWAREELLEYASRNPTLWRVLMRMAGYHVDRDTRPEDLISAMRVVSFRPDPDRE